MREIEVLKYADKNPVTEKEHHKEVLWQITIPLLVGLVLILAIGVVVVLAAVDGAGSVGVGADIALIWLIIPAMIVLLVFTVLFGGLTYGVMKLIEVLPKYLFKLQNLIVQVEGILRSVSDSAAKPVITIDSFWAAVRALLRQ